MNIVFADRASQMAFCHAASEPKHQDQIHSWLLRFFMGGWHTIDGDTPTDPNNAARAHYRGWEAHRSPRLTIRAHDLRVAPGLPVGPPTTDEFSWAVHLYPVDSYGIPDPNYTPTRDDLIMHGGLINHGDWENPSWSSHT